jgi:hypothetical protein
MNNYYPFGMLQLGRYCQSGDYRFGFIPIASGQAFMEKDDEVKGVMNSIFTQPRQ